MGSCARNSGPRNHDVGGDVRAADPDQRGMHGAYDGKSVASPARHGRQQVAGAHLHRGLGEEHHPDQKFTIEQLEHYISGERG